MNKITLVPYDPRKKQHLLFQELLLLDKDIQKEVPYLFGTTTMLIVKEEKIVGAINTIQAGANTVLLEYGLLPNYRHQGLAREALQEWIQNLFTNGSEKVILSIAEHNTSSKSLAQSLGFSLDYELTELMIEEGIAPAYTLKKEL